MHLQQRLDLLQRLKEYISSDDDIWLQTIERAHRENGWFTPEFIHLAIDHIASEYLDADKLVEWTKKYALTDGPSSTKNVGIVMAGNIPMVGFHDFLSVFVAGHRQTIKPSSKDDILIRHLVAKLIEWHPNVKEWVAFADMLKECDAYIATGSNNSSRYFEYYFSKYAHVIRRNRTSVAVLTGKETGTQLERLADDVYQYFGLGCRNVTKIYVPRQYAFVPLLEAFNKYSYLADHNKYRNNYDYQLALLIMNKQYYMTNGSIILSEHASEFSAISRLNYEFYDVERDVHEGLCNNKNIQCVVGLTNVPFGQTQHPALADYADGIDTMLFLRAL